MYPTVEILGVTFHIFGVILACTWFLFFVLLHHFSLRQGIIRPVFSDIIGFTIAMFFSARIFHIFSDWLNEKFILMELIDGNMISFLKLFFTPQNYFFSLFGAIFGFFMVFLYKTRGIKKERPRYLDAIVPAFLFSSLLGYFGAFLGGQTYGIPFDSFISVHYNHADSIVKDRAALFPLAPFYMILTSILLFGLYKFSNGKKIPEGIFGLIGIGAYSLMIFFIEFLSGSRKDIFYDYFSLGLNQIGALCGIIFVILGLLRIIQRKI